MDSQSNGVTDFWSEVAGGADSGVSMLPAKLVLEDGKMFSGYSFGYDGSTAGEVVFNTGMVGYPESLTDPSYAGQILTITYPLVGNYGVPAFETDENGLSKFFESERIQISGLVVADYSFTASHFTAKMTLAEWLKDSKIPGIAGVDTRAVTKYIREKGAMLGKIVVGDVEPSTVALVDPNKRNLVADVSCKESKVYLSAAERMFREGKEGPVPADGGRDRLIRIVAVDCGMKQNIIRHFICNLPYRVELKVVPWDYPFGDEEMDGLFISNGPGDPSMCGVTIANIQKVMQRPVCIPIFGICLGNQLLALAAGAKTYKMKFGNRGMNQPVIDCRSSRCYISPQNHGFAVDTTSLPNGWAEFFVNANDKSNEGIIHRKKPWFSVQFHPEAAGGPTDTAFLFEDFLSSVRDPGMISVTTIPIQFPLSAMRILLLGSGGLSIGQAGEFDYSGSQCIKALKESSVEVILINPNIATVQTSQGLADRVYFLPVTPEFVEKVIAKERPDGILVTFGGQTALNCGVKLEQSGVLAKYNVRVLGTPVAAIVATEDRDVFAKRLASIGEKCAPSYIATTVEDTVAGAAKIGYPVLVRAAFALGGLGSGFASNEEELRKLAVDAFAFSEQVIVDKSLKGWKEVEYEVVRDCRDNCITVCNMENFDPLGIHTGDSIVVAPSQTLSNAEFYKLRETAIKVIRHFGVVGECNIQYAVDPLSHDYCIVEVNARLSRSSALASKATGYPLAYVAAKLALGMDLVQVRNAVTKCTTACFEPSLDYVVVKMPRWDLKKFGSVDSKMGSAMKSVGEVMAIGRTFEECFQKALRMVDDSSMGFDGDKFSSVDDQGLEAELSQPSDRRVWSIAKALEVGFDIERIHQLTKIDRWFLAKLNNIHLMKKRLSGFRLSELSVPMLKHVKKLGFSDKQIGAYLKVQRTPEEVRACRVAMGVRPWVKQIDTLAAEYPAHTNYLYLTYLGDDHDVTPLVTNNAAIPPRGNISANGGAYNKNQLPPNSSRLASPRSTSPTAFNRSDSSRLMPRLAPADAYEDEPSRLVGGPLGMMSRRASRDDDYTEQVNGHAPVIVLGCGCYRIGSSVEFDWSCMSCVKTLRHIGHQAIVVNCNPETVSTDFDESDRLYFEDLSLETVLDIWEFECSAMGVVISMGGQTPNNLALGLDRNGVRVLGTSVKDIDAAEDRRKFSNLCDELNIDQPEWSAFSTFEAALDFSNKVEFPVLVRPSYVLSGAAMRVVTEEKELRVFLNEAAVVSKEHPVVISKYIVSAKEVEMDAVAADGEVINYAISEHVENAGVHSGDATLVLPAQKLYVETIRRVKKISQKIAKALRISGPFNIQFMCKQNDVKVIECNLRASRTFPFISKTFNANFIELATRIMVGAAFRAFPIHLVDLEFVGVKAPMFSFSRLRGADPVLGVDMRSTGEVACFGSNKYDALLKALLSTGIKIPSLSKAVLISAGPLSGKVEFLPYAQGLAKLGYSIYATAGTFSFLVANGVPNVKMCLKPDKALADGSGAPGAIQLLVRGDVDLVINVPESMDSKAMTNGYQIRRAAIDNGVSLLTDIRLAGLFIEALQRKKHREMNNKPFFEILSWNEYQGM